MISLEAIDGVTTWLTVNKRLAAELHSRYDQAQLRSGRQAWPSPDILPWSAWLARLYAQLLDAGRTELELLSPAQERLLWEDVVTRETAAAGLLRPAAAAESAQAAFALYNAWQLDAPVLARYGNEETASYLAWMRAFNAHLSRHGLLSAAQLPALLTSAFSRGNLEAPAALLHSGFDALSPAQTALFEALEERGCVVREQRPRDCANSRRRTEAPDAEAEMRLAAHWAHGLTRTDPRVRVGIVSLRLAQQRRDLERVFTEIITPAVCLTDSGRQGAFNLSLGEPLSECPQVAHALLALRLLGGQQPLNAIGQLLRSPFIGGHEIEWEGRALLDAALREDGLPQLDLQRLSNRMAHFVPGDPRRCEDLAARTQGLLATRRDLPAKDTPGAWAGRFQAILVEFGWPGDRPLDSREFQQHERMQRLFSELAQLTRVRPAMSLVEAVNRLARLAADTLFQPKSPPAPIQILGGLEAAGMDFDALWLLGADDRNWPPSPNPNPLLPTRLQRELGMPHASAARELAFAARLTERLVSCAATVIASHARTEAEHEQRTSPLLLDWPLVDSRELGIAAVEIVREACASPGTLEPLPAADAVGAPPEAAGGASLLAAQANCPFQAVARFRLGARPLEEASFAPDAALTGKLVHELLQRLWQKLMDSASLARHENEALMQIIEPLSLATLDDIGRRRPDLFTPRFRAIEAARLGRLMLDWLALERRRTRPFEVAALEQEQTIELAGLRLKTRADRVDRLDDGSLAVIDYKTGRTLRNDGWFDERLTEPQLPLYCVHSGGEVHAALLARVRRDGPGCAFLGLSREDDFAPGVKSPQQQDNDLDWPGLLAHWQRALSGLAGEIVQGRADATPSPQACRYCALGALCRVEELTAENGRE